MYIQLMKAKNIELFTPSFSGVFSIGYEWPLNKIKLDYTGRIMGPMQLPTYEEELPEMKFTLVYLTTFKSRKKIH